MVILVEEDGRRRVLRVEVDESESELDETLEVTEETVERSTSNNQQGPTQNTEHQLFS